MSQFEVTVWHLEMTDPGQLRPAYESEPELEYRQSRVCLPGFGLFLNNAVGAAYHWKMRTRWTDQDWHHFWERPELQVWVAYLDGTPIGFFELEADGEGNTEILKFGVIAEFVGKGFGGRMLTHAVRLAWESGAERIWLHTCSLDHPHARNHYEARGFQLFKTETELRDQPKHA